MYKLGRTEKVIPQIRNGKPIVRVAKVAVKKVEETMGEVKKSLVHVTECLSSNFC